MGGKLGTLFAGARGEVVFSYAFPWRLTAKEQCGKVTMNSEK
jgi:hypothetical protein